MTASTVVTVDDALVFPLTFLPAVLVGTVMWAVTRSCSADGAAPDPLVGIRTRATKSSPQAWVRGHRAALPLARASGLLSLVVTAAVVLAAVLGSAGVVPRTAASVLAVVGFLAVVGTCGAAALVADRAARQTS